VAQFPGRRITMGVRNDCGERQKSQQCHKYFLQYSTFASARPQVRTWGAKFCSCPGRHLTSLCPCLLCVHFKIFERLIYTRVEPIIAPTTRLEQAGFRHGRSTVDQVTLLTQDTEGSCSAKKKAVAVFVDTTAAYETA